VARELDRRSVDLSLIRAIELLAQEDWITADHGDGTDGPLSARPLAKALTGTRGWPGADAEAAGERLITALEELAAQEPDEERSARSLLGCASSRSTSAPRRSANWAPRCSRARCDRTRGAITHRNRDPRPNWSGAAAEVAARQRSPQTRRTYAVVYRSLIGFLGEHAAIEDSRPKPCGRTATHLSTPTARPPSSPASLHDPGARGCRRADADVRTVRSASVARGEPRALSHEEFARLLTMPDPPHPPRQA
jgi:hypothetical protein